MPRQMHLLAYLKTGPTADFAGGWRHPAAELDNIFEPDRYIAIAKLLEAACFDGCFFADLFGLYDVHGGSFDAYVRRGGQISFLDPMTVLPVMGAVTRHLGLGATLSTSFHSAYHLARTLASLDLFTKGRVAWNVVTSATDLEARNFGLDEIPPRDERYDRADEVLEACMALWHGWEPGAFVLDRAAGVFADPAKVHYANYAGRWVRTRGPLSIPRSPQDHPVLMQAGSSARGRQFAARWAEMIFTAQRGLNDMREFRADMHTRMAAVGRTPDMCAVLPLMSVVIGETESIAWEKAAYLESLIDPELMMAFKSSNLGADLTRVGSAQELQTAQGNQGIQGSLDMMAQTMRDEGLTFEQLKHRAKHEHLIVGTPASIADYMQHIFESGGCDGFVVCPTYFPGMFEDFCRMVVPELQRRGLFRRAYQGRTLRENLRDDASLRAAL